MKLWILKALSRSYGWRPAEIRAMIIAADTAESARALACAATDDEYTWSWRYSSCACLGDWQGDIGVLDRIYL